MDAFDLLVQGDIFGSILQPYIDLMGVPGADIFFVFLYTTALGLIYLKTRNVMLTGITMMLTSSILIPTIPPNLQKYFFIAIIIGVSLTIYKIFR